VTGQCGIFLSVNGTVNRLISKSVSLQTNQSASKFLFVSGTTTATVCCYLLLLHPFNGLFSRTIWVSRYQKGKTRLDLNEARDDGVLGSY